MFRSALQSFLFGAICLTGFASGEPVRVDLLGRLEISTEVARIADIARVSGGDLISRRKIAELDIAKMDSDTMRVTKRQVQLRILLGGLPAEKFRVVGAESVTLILSKAPSPESLIVQSLKTDVADRLKVKPADLRLQLAQPLAGNLVRYFTPQYGLEPLLPNTVRVGALTARIQIRDGERLVRTVPVSLDVQVFRTVFVANRDIEPGETLAVDDVQEERRLVSGRKKDVPTAVVGKQIKKAISKGHVIAESDLARPAKPKREIVIRSRDVIEIAVVSRALQAKVSGAIAMQNGAVGETIRVKNPAGSGKVLTAKVVSAGRVEIRL